MNTGSVAGSNAALDPRARDRWQQSPISLAARADCANGLEHWSASARRRGAPDPFRFRWRTPEAVHACTRAYSGFSPPIIRTHADCSLQQIASTIQVTIHETANRERPRAGAAEGQARFCSVTPNLGAALGTRDCRHDIWRGCSRPRPRRRSMVTDGLRTRSTDCIGNTTSSIPSALGFEPSAVPSGSSQTRV